MRFHEISESVPPYVEDPIMFNPTSQEVAACFARSPYVSGKYGTVQNKYPVVRGIQTKDGNVFVGCGSRYTHGNLIHWARGQGSPYEYDEGRAEFVVFADGTLSSRVYWNPDSGSLPFFANWEKAIARVKKARSQ